MSISLLSNIAALQAQRRLASAARGQGESALRLSSGLRINKGSDDAAGLAVSTALNSRGRVYDQALRNANDGISALTVAEGASAQLNDILTRLKELAQGAANGSYSRTQRLSLDSEANSLTQEFNRVVATTSFNGRALFDRSFGKLNIQLGYGSSELISGDVGQGLQHAVGSGGFSGADEQILTGGAQAARGATADFNGDGYLDLVLPDAAITVLLGEGTGTFSKSTALSGAKFSIANSVAVADLNGDGVTDIIAGTSSGLAVFINSGDGSNFTKTTVSTPSLGELAVGDFNGDNKIDVAGVNSNGLNIWLGNGDGTIQAVKSISAGATVSFLKAGDLNGDNVIDFVAADSSGNAYLFQGSGSGSAALKSSFSAGMTSGIDLADINHDGILDLGGVSTSGSTMIISLGNGNFTFGVAKASKSGAGAFGANFVDLNGDGNLDFVTGSMGEGSTTSATFHYGNGDGTFGSRMHVTTGTNDSASTSAAGLTFGDFNGDGVVDIAAEDVVSFNSIAAVLLANTSQLCSIARLDLTTQSSARSALSTLDSIMTRVSKELGNIGATQSRLSSAMNTLGATRDNYSAAATRITDVDVASESADLLRHQILTQTAGAVLAQANQSPGLLLRLLQDI